MEGRYLLDTNTASYIIRGSHPAVDRRLECVPAERIAISTATEGELRFGAARRPEATRLYSLIEDFFLRVTILPWDSEAAREYGELRADLEGRGQSIGNLDTMIAAHALAVGAVLVSSDHVFGRIRGLIVEDWTVHR